MPDVSVEDVVNGKDVQGIPWEKMLFPRDQYREMKMKGYKNYQNLSYAREDALQVPLLGSHACYALFISPFTAAQRQTILSSLMDHKSV